MSAIDDMIIGAGDLAVWLNPSLKDTLTMSGVQKVSKIKDKVTNRLFNYASTTDDLIYNTTPSVNNIDTTTFKKPAIKLDNSWFYTNGDGTNIGPVQVTNADGEFTYFGVFRLDYDLADQNFVPIMFFGGRENANKYYASGPSSSISLKQVPSVDDPNKCSIRIRINSPTSVFTNYFDTNPISGALIKITLKKELNYSTLKFYINSVLVYENTTITNYSFANTLTRSIGIDRTLGAGRSAFGEIIIYKQYLDDSQCAPIDAYLSSEWIIPSNQINIGDLYTNIGVRNSTITTSIETTNATNLTARVLPTDALSGISVTLNNYNDVDDITVWNLQATLPSFVASFILELTATNPGLGLSKTKQFKIYNTLNGDISSEQLLYESLGKLALCLDAADTTCKTINLGTGAVLSLREKVTGAKFNIASSETPKVDATTFIAQSLSFADPAQSTSGLNYSASLDLTTYPDLNVVDTSIFTVNHSGTYDNAVKSNGFTINNDQGEYTVIYVGSYTGKAGGSNIANMFIGSDFPYETAAEYYEPRFELSTALYRSDSLEMRQQDAGKLVSSHQANLQQSTDVVGVNEKFIVMWRKKSGQAPEMKLFKNNLTETFVYGGSTWESGLVKISRLYGSHSIGSFAQLLAYSEALSDQTYSNLIDYLNQKWLVDVALEPNFINLSKTTEYIQQNFRATVDIGNGTNDPISAVTIAATNGTGWTITPSQTVVNQYDIFGIMPDTAASFTITLSATQSGKTGSKVFNIEALDLPDGAIIGDLSNLTGEIFSDFSAELDIIDADSVSISAAAGSDWEISKVSDNHYIVNGKLPSITTIFDITIKANRISVALSPQVTVQTQRVFQILVTRDETVRQTPFPLDVTGFLDSNKVTEYQVVTTSNGNNRLSIVPEYAPFFLNGFKLEYKKDTSQTWYEALLHIDYQPYFEFSDLSNYTDSKIYGAISILNTAIDGNVRITYQTLGGVFATSRVVLFNTLANIANNTRSIRWGQIVDLPEVFPPTEHTHINDEDLIGLSDVTQAVDDINQIPNANYLSKDIRDMATHIADRGNPHQLNKALVDLGNVPNLKPATLAQAINIALNNCLMTPQTVALAATTYIVEGTQSVDGRIKLNSGLLPNDDDDSAKGVTALGLINLMNKTTNNAIKTAFSGGEKVGFIKPWPLTFPRYWRGVKYNTIEQLIFAITTFLDIETMVVNYSTGEIRIPKQLTLPNLTTTSNAGSYTLRDKTTEDWTELPLHIPIVT